MGDIQKKMDFLNDLNQYKRNHENKKRQHVLFKTETRNKNRELFIERNKEISANIKNAKLGKLLENYTLSGEIKSNAKSYLEKSRIQCEKNTIEGEKQEQSQL